MERREPEESSGELWNCLDSDGRPGIFKLAVCKDISLLPSGRVTDLPGTDGCMSCMRALDMT